MSTAAVAHASLSLAMSFAARLLREVSVGGSSVSRARRLA